MSDFEQIFFDPAPVPVERAAMRLASALDLDFDNASGLARLTDRPEEVSLPADVSGTVETNIYAETSPAGLDQVSIFDDLPLVFEFRSSHADKAVQQEIGWILFRRMTERLRWRSVLTSEYALLIASFDTTRGLRSYDEGTLSDGTHAVLWR